MLYMHGGILKCCGEGPHRVDYQKSQALHVPSDFENVHTLVENVESKLFNSVQYNTMFCIRYYLLKRTFTIICDNDLIPLLFPQKTTI